MSKWWKNSHGSLIDLEKFVEIWIAGYSIYGSTICSETWEIDEFKDEKKLDLGFSAIYRFLNRDKE